MRIYRKAVDPALSAQALHDAAYALLCEVLRQDWNCPDPVIEKTPLGKPFLRGEGMPCISVSHTRGLVCCAVSETPVGMDCEYPRPVPRRVLQRVCTPAELCALDAAAEPEAQALCLWVLKESISKKLGVGLKAPFTQYDITFTPDGPVCSGHTLHLERYDSFFIAAAE